MAMKKKKNNDNNNSISITINDLPSCLIQGILLRLPVKDLKRLRRVSKLWLSLISDPNFKNLHLQLSPSRTHRCLFIQESGARSLDIDALFRDDNGRHAAASVKVPLSLKTKKPSQFEVLGSCRGFILLHQKPHFFIIWNPLTGSHKRISYYHIVRNTADDGSYEGRFKLLDNTLLFGFGYDGLEDDYLVVLAWSDRKKNKEEDHFGFFSLRTKAWRSFGVALPNPLRRNKWERGVFFNGAVHWLAYPLDDAGDDIATILKFDLTERSFSEIHVPEQVTRYKASHLMVLGESLALYFWKDDKKTEIWVMKECSVQSSWTLYEISSKSFQPVCLSNGGDIIGFDGPRGLSKYSVRGELIKHYEHVPGLFKYTMYTMYTESL